MIPESKIPECAEHEVKSKIGNILVNEKKFLKNILLRFMTLILIFMSITKKKYKLTKIGANTYFLELMFVLLNIFQLQKLMNKKHVDKDLIFEEKREESLEKT